MNYWKKKKLIEENNKYKNKIQKKDKEINNNKNEEKENMNEIIYKEKEKALMERIKD